MAETVLICEVAPRDGLQMAKTHMATEAKIAWIAAIAAAGVRAIEAGSFVPPRVIPQMADTEAVVRASATLGCDIVALAPNLRGAEAAYAAGADRICVPMSVSQGHSRANLNRSPTEQVSELRRIVAWLHAQDRVVPVTVPLSTAFGCSIDGAVPERDVVALAEAVAAAGADSLGLADTVGYANPAAIRRVVRAVRSATGVTLQTLHLHDTMGLGLANAAAGLDEGIRSFDASLAGLGGCPYAPGASGNIVTEDLVFLLESMGFDTGIDLQRLLAARALLAAALPGETLHGAVAKAGLPRTFRRAA